MSLSSIEFIKTDDITVKEECELNPEPEHCTDNAGSDAFHLRSNGTKCGEIFMCSNDIFILVCGYCDELCVSMENFGGHIRDNHLNVEIENASTSGPILSPVEESEGLLPKEALEDVEDVPKNDEIQEKECPNGSSDDEEYNKESDEFSEDGSSSEYEPEKRGRRKTCSEPNPSLFCSKCNRQYKSTITFTRHIKNVHDENRIGRKPLNLKCRYCDKEFATEEELSEHKNTHDRFRPFQCPQCPKSFTSSNHRQKHINMHMGYRPYKCTKCPSAFGTECNLRQHMLTHAVAGPLSCKICGKQFIHQSRKDVHMRSHTGEKPFQCELCGRKFIIRSRLTEHMKRHNNTRNHECEICGKKFYTNVMLKHHQVAHSTDRPFVCSECGKTFPRKLSLKMHRKIHSDVKQYSCNICGKEFRQYAGLYAHRKSHGEKKGLPQTNIAVSDKFTPPTHLLVVKGDDEMSAEDDS